MQVQVLVAVSQNEPSQHVPCAICPGGRVLSPGVQVSPGEPHVVCPWHRPPLHVSPFGQRRPHTPQLFGSSLVFVHTPPQRTGHAQTPRAQVSPFGQCRPHAPQLFGSSLVVTSHALIGSPSQFAWPAGQQSWLLHELPEQHSPAPEQAASSGWQARQAPPSQTSPAQQLRPAPQAAFRFTQQTPPAIGSVQCVVASQHAELTPHACPAAPVQHW